MLLPAGACAGLSRPVDGDLLRGFAPIGRYGGHWGIDLSADIGTIVRSADEGVVSFAGEVAGVISVTVAHGGGLRTSYSYLESASVTTGESVARSTEVGRSGIDHDLAALHFSVRVGDGYRDPLSWLGCFRAPHPGLRLVSVPHAYASVRATRHSWRYIRSSSLGSPFCGRGGVSRPRS